MIFMHLNLKKLFYYYSTRFRIFLRIYYQILFFAFESVNLKQKKYINYKINTNTKL